MSSLLQYLLCHSSKCWQQKVFGTCIHILMRYSLSKITSRGLDFQIQKKKQKKRLNFQKKKKIFLNQIANICWIIKKAREFQKNIYFCFIHYTKAFDCVDQNKLWKILKEMGIPDHLTCLLRNLYAGQEGTVRTGHGTTDWFQIGKGVRQGCILSPCLFNLYAEYIMRNAGLESRLPGEISITSDMQEKEMATHSGTLAWEIPWTEEPGRLQSMGSQTVRYD